MAMPSSYDYRKYAVLFVDDEEQSLKYFGKAFEKDFRVMTASSAADAWELLEKHIGQIAILITDQRMPGETGIDLLARARRSMPNIVRILTTAYSDLDSAIESVNIGAVYRYIVKPWDLRELRGSLRGAMERFLLERERDHLLREKLSVLQRMIVADRVRSLAVMAAGLAHHVRNSMGALKNFLNQVPAKLHEEITDPDLMNDPAFWENLWGMAQRESHRLIDIVQDVVDLTVKPSYSFDAQEDLEQLINDATSGYASVGSGSSTSVSIPGGLPKLMVDGTMARRMFRIMLETMAHAGQPGGTITITAEQDDDVWGTAGVRVALRSDGPAWSADQLTSLFTVFAPPEHAPSDVGVNLLSAFFIAHHHGGEIQILSGKAGKPGFDILLPFDPREAERPALEEDFLDKVFLHMEAWSAMQSES